MALRKVKDLIREMIFETSSAEHQYTEVMRSFAFDTNVDYDQKLEEAEKEASKYDKKIQRINAGLDRQKKIIKDAPKKKNDYAKEVFISGMQKLNSQRDSLETRQRETIQKKQEVGFRSLSSETKKYACLLYLANTCIKNGDFSIQDGQEEVDEYQFKASQIATNFREISDYADYIFSTRESKIKKPEDILSIIRADAQNIGLEFKEISAENITQVYNALLNNIANENNDKLSEKEQIELSKIGIEPVRDFGNGLKMYRLMPDTEYYKKNKEHRNLVYESNQLGICIGQKAQAYSRKILELDKNQYYTLRSEEKNGQLVPHCTIEVNSDIIAQVKGNSNGPVNADYIKQVREFLKKDLKCVFPGEQEQSGIRKLYDYSNIGFIKDKNNKTVDVFNLPPNTEFRYFDYQMYKLKGVSLKNIKSIDTLDCTNQTITQKDIDDMEKISNVKNISFQHAKLKGKLDFSEVKNLNLSYVDLSGVTEIKFNPYVESINLLSCKGLKGKFDFSGVKKLYLGSVDLSEVTEIKFNPNAENINLSSCKLKGKFDFSEFKRLNLSGVDLSEVTEIKFNPNAESIDLSDCKGLKGKFDFSGFKRLNLSGADLSEVTDIKFNPNAESINLPHCKGLKGKLDFSEFKRLNLSGADLSEVTDIKFNPNAESICLSGCKGLKGEFDFSGVKNLDLCKADLSNVTEIKFNPNAESIYLSECKGLKGEFDFSGVKNLGLCKADLSNVTSIKLGQLCLSAVIELINTGFKGKLDFSGVKKLYLSDVDLSKVTDIKFNPNAESIDLYHCKGLKGKLDFSGVKKLYLSYVDLSEVTEIKFNPYVESINLSSCKGLKGKLDFSGVKKLYLYDSDLSNVIEIKFNPNADDIRLVRCKGVKGELDFSEVKQLFIDDTKVANINSLKTNPNGEVSVDLLKVDIVGKIKQTFKNATQTLAGKFKRNPKDRENG